MSGFCDILKLQIKKGLATDNGLQNIDLLGVYRKTILISKKRETL